MGNHLSDADIRALLQSAKRIAVVGLSPVAARPSYGVTKYLINHGYDIVGVRPASPAEILGKPCVERLDQLHSPIDIIDVFRNSDAIPGLIDDLEKWIATLPAGQKPKTLWLQEGVTHKEAEERARKLGFQVVANKCILKEHVRLLGS